mmetsp:Transcript_13089/g.27750  ORF Transcript_13089/g.27750 Transcript_13089/m.27750 type:complete len:281 (-) Transcript_13089:128-970(-)
MAKIVAIAIVIVIVIVILSVVVAVIILLTLLNRVQYLGKLLFRQSRIRIRDRKVIMQPGPPDAKELDASVFQKPNRCQRGVSFARRIRSAIGEFVDNGHDGSGFRSSLVLQATALRSRHFQCESLKRSEKGGCQGDRAPQKKRRILEEWTQKGDASAFGRDDALFAADRIVPMTPLRRCPPLVSVQFLPPPLLPIIPTRFLASQALQNDTPRIAPTRRSSHGRLERLVATETTCWDFVEVVEVELVAVQEKGRRRTMTIRMTTTIPKIALSRRRRNEGKE